MVRYLGKSLAELGKQQVEERKRLEKERQQQWDDVDKHVPIYELAKDQPDEAGDKKQKPKKQSNVRNDGMNGKVLTLNDLKKKSNGIDNSPVLNGNAVNGVHEKKNGHSKKNHKLSNKERRKAKKDRLTYRDEIKKMAATDKGEIAGLSPAKLQKTSLAKKFSSSSSSASSKSSSNAGPSPSRSELSDSFISLKDLQPGPVVPVRRNINFSQESETISTSYLVTTPSDEEAENEDESWEPDSEDDVDGYNASSAYISDKIRSMLDVNADYDSDEDGSDGVEDEDEYLGEVIDLQEDSDGTVEDDEIDEEDMDFIDDSPEAAEDGDWSDELSEITDESEGRIEELPSDDDQQNKENVRKDESMDVDQDDDYDSAEDSDFDEEEEEQDEEDNAVLGPVDAREIDELLVDACDMMSDDDLDDEDIEFEADPLIQAKLENIHPAGLLNSPIQMTINGFECNEPGGSMVLVSKKSGFKWNPEKFSLFCWSKEDEHSVNTAVKAFKWLHNRFRHIYARRCLVVHRQTKDYYSPVFPVSSFFKMFQDNFLEYGVNVNVASYKDGQRTTHNREGRATAGRIAQHFADGLSVQCVNPQSFNKNIHYICDVLQELFNCFVGANCYYTPKGSAGFAPHWDDIDAFLIQMEGRKHWKVYGPADTDEIWPEDPSHNFSLDEMAERKQNLIFDGWLEAGDLLYLPRGFIHCASTDPNQDSLHVTVSLAQSFNYATMVKATVDKMVDDQVQAICQVRRNLPVNFGEICGVADSNYDNEDQFEKKLEYPLTLYLEQLQHSLIASIPSAVDEVVRTSIRKSLPPLLTPYEKNHSIFGADNAIPKPVKFTESAEVRLIRKHTQRLLFEAPDRPFLVHRMENSMAYEGRPEVVVDLQPQWTSMIESLFKYYPDWTSVKQLGSDKKETVAMCRFLFDLGVLLVNTNIISKRATIQCVVEKPKEGIVGVLKKTHISRAKRTFKKSAVNESSDSNDSQKKVTFSPQLCRVKKFDKDHPIMKEKAKKKLAKKSKLIENGKVKKNKKTKNRNGGKRNKNKFKDSPLQ